MFFVLLLTPVLIFNQFNMPSITAPDGEPYMPVEEMEALDGESSLSGVLPSFGGPYPGRIGAVQRDGFDIITPEGVRLGDLHQRILSFSLGGHQREIGAAIDRARARFPGMTMVDTSQRFEPATLLMQDLHDAFKPYGDYLIYLATTGTGANEQAIRLAMGSLGGHENTQMLALARNYPGASALMNAVCDAPGWHGVTSLPSPAKILALDGSNMNEVFAQCSSDGKKPILIMEDGVQGVGDFNVLDEKFLRELAERVDDAGGRKIYDNVQDLVRATGGKGLFGFNRWADPANPKHLPDIVTFAKGIADGYAQAGLAISRPVAEQCRDFGGVLAGSGAAPGVGTTFDTFSRVRDSLVAARTVLAVSRKARLDQNVHERGEQFQGNLHPMVDRYAGVVSKVVGIGGMTGIEFRDAEKLKQGMIAAPDCAITVAKGGLAMRLPLQFDTPPEFVERVSGCVETMLRAVQAQTGA